MTNLEKIILHGENYKKLKQLQKIDFVEVDELEQVQEKIDTEKVIQCIN